MQLRKLYRTVETIASKKFESDEDLLRHVLHEIVQNEEISIKGGRAWRFGAKTGSYELLYQVGEMEPIKQHYRIKVKDYPIFLELPKLRKLEEYGVVLHFDAVVLLDRFHFADLVEQLIGAGFCPEPPGTSSFDADFFVLDDFVEDMAEQILIALKFLGSDRFNGAIKFSELHVSLLL